MKFPLLKTLARLIAILLTLGGPCIKPGRIGVLTSMRRDAPHVMFGLGLRNG